MLRSFGLSFLAATAQAGTLYPVNDGFEVPSPVSGGYQYAPSGAGVGWTFGGAAGIAANGSGFGVTGASNTNQNGGATNNPGQAAFLQGSSGNGLVNGAASMSQSLSFAGTQSSISFDIEQRTDYGTTAAVNVYLDNTLLGSYTTSVHNFTPETTPTFSATGIHTITFSGYIGTPGNGDTLFVDNVSITNNTPEPASFILCGLGALGLFFTARRRRKA